jgi:hypothetical protein
MHCSEITEQAECEADADCSGIYGTPLEPIDPGATQFCREEEGEWLGCKDAGLECPPVVTYACKDGDVWELGGCPPSGPFEICEEPGEIVGPCEDGDASPGP